MADVGDNNFIRYIYRGEEGEIIPREATHIFVGKDVTFVLERAFQRHPNIVEIICHEGVEKIEEWAFSFCPRLRMIIMPGVKIVEPSAIQWSTALNDVECGKLEIIREAAFICCKSLRSINLPSAKIVEEDAFSKAALTNVKFGSKLERIEGGAFVDCESLGRIAIPLKDGIITDDDIFSGCRNLRHVDLIEGELHETIAALHLKAWRNDMNEEINSINEILPNAPAGDEWSDDAMEYGDPGEKALVIREWIRSVLHKIIRYQAEHERLLNEAASVLRHVLAQDVLINNVLPFLALPAHTFEVAEDSEEEDSEDELEVEFSSQGEDSEEDSEEEEEDDYLGGERNDSNEEGQDEGEEEEEEYDQDETAQRGRDKRQRR
jgi:hypothetical protein